MAVTPKTLVSPKYIEAVQTTQYTAPISGHTLIDKFTVTNIDTVNGTVSVNIVPSGGAAGSSNLIVKSRTLAPNETYTFPMIVGHILDGGTFISAIASSASVLVLYISGREITS